MDYKLCILRGIDERYIYQFTRKPKDIDDVIAFGDMTEYDLKHTKILKKQKRLVSDTGGGYVSKADEIQREFEELIKESNRRDDEVTKRLKGSGKYVAGLDTNREAYKENSKWFAAQIEALKEKYKDS